MKPHDAILMQTGTLSFVVGVDLYTTLKTNHSTKSRTHYTQSYTVYLWKWHWFHCYQNSYCLLCHVPHVLLPLAVHVVVLD